MVQESGPSAELLLWRLGFLQPSQDISILAPEDTHMEERNNSASGVTTRFH